MPRRELLTPTERVQLFAFSEDEGELIQLATLARADLTYIRRHRGDHNRLGLAIQMVYLRHPSRVLPPNEALALQTTQGMVLAHAVANELRTRHILLPTVDEGHA